MYQLIRKIAAYAKSEFQHYCAMKRIERCKLQREKSRVRQTVNLICGGTR